MDEVQPNVFAGDMAARACLMSLNDRLLRRQGAVRRARDVLMSAAVMDQGAASSDYWEAVGAIDELHWVRDYITDQIELLGPAEGR